MALLLPDEIGLIRPSLNQKLPLLLKVYLSSDKFRQYSRTQLLLHALVYSLDDGQVGHNLCGMVNHKLLFVYHKMVKLPDLRSAGCAK